MKKLIISNILNICSFDFNKCNNCIILMVGNYYPLTNGKLESRFRDVKLWNNVVIVLKKCIGKKCPVDNVSGPTRFHTTSALNKI